MSSTETVTALQELAQHVEHKNRVAPYVAAPSWGVKCVRGSRNVQEDAHTAQPDLVGEGQASSLSFFGVFDGHGGSEASQHAAERLHVHFSTSVRRKCGCSLDSSSSASSAVSASSDAALETRSSTQSTQPDADMVEVESCSSATGWATSVRSMVSVSDRYNRHVCTALTDAFIRTDAELAGTEVGELVGTTAVVAVVGARELYIASVGDSRAVLCRKGMAMPLTKDHKPNRHDEMARVVGLGGKVVLKGGSHRIMGLLAMSRAIGDHFLRPFVIPEPETQAIARTAEDELLLLASDGLWDVFSSQEATTLALRSIMRARDRGASAAAACRIAASVLARGAQERGSKDNITVLVVDLRRAEAVTVSSVAAVLAAQCSDMPFSASRKRLSSDGDLAKGPLRLGLPPPAGGSAGSSQRSSTGGLGSSTGALQHNRQLQQQSVPLPGQLHQQQPAHVHALANTWAYAASTVTPGGSSSSSGGGMNPFNSGSGNTSSPAPGMVATDGNVRVSSSGRFTVHTGYKGNPAPLQPQQQQQQQQTQQDAGSSKPPLPQEPGRGSGSCRGWQQQQQQQGAQGLPERRLQQVKSAPILRGYLATVTTALNAMPAQPPAAAAPSGPSVAGPAAPSGVAMAPEQQVAAVAGLLRTSTSDSAATMADLGQVGLLSLEGTNSAISGMGGLSSPQLSVSSDGVVRPAIVTEGPLVVPVVGPAAAAAAAGGGGNC